MASAEPLALGELGLTPEAFGRLTVTEFTWMLRGARRKARRELHALASVIASALSPFVTDRVEAEHLLGWPKNWWVEDGDR